MKLLKTETKSLRIGSSNETSIQVNTTSYFVIFHRRKRNMKVIVMHYCDFHHEYICGKKEAQNPPEKFVRFMNENATNDDYNVCSSYFTYTLLIFFFYFLSFFFYSNSLYSFQFPDMNANKVIFLIFFCIYVLLVGFVFTSNETKKVQINWKAIMNYKYMLFNVHCIVICFRSIKFNQINL